MVLHSYDQFFKKYRSKGPSEHHRRVGFYEFCVTWDGFFASFLLADSERDEQENSVVYLHHLANVTDATEP
jgi:hypothetical protein